MREYAIIFGIGVVAAGVTIFVLGTLGNFGYDYRQLLPQRAPATGSGG